MKRALQYHKGSYSITIPSEIVTTLGMQRGDVLMFSLNGNGFYANLEKPTQDKEIMTLGYEGRTLDQFIEILLNNKIEQLIDVREIAFSRKNGFSKTALAEKLKANNIVYRHFPQLGTPKDIREEYYKSHNFSDLAEKFEVRFQTTGAKEVLFDAIGLASIRKSALMCFERSASKCHRSIIAKKMASEGFKVTNL